ncbi:putative ABC transport system permease protein [Haladaptatus litoreus]|uniref:Putative ABC transport system permease protein n=1 Tax=Haladaptatus litoreus TaxID=553468 RepID=A0A1N7BQP8_9EURY|nr:ABC transporter permease [Haladaptatus litoreus]SIR53658.1 putative ABC transport system permease protein [Haladaptatus litoreus]
MDAREVFRMSWRSIRGHKLRSSLTTLGVIIGVAAVIALATLGASVQASIIGDVGGEEAQQIYVWAAPEGQQGAPGAGAQPVFSERDIDRIEEIEGVESVIPRGSVPTSGLRYGNDTVARSDVVAITPAYFDGAEFESGGAFSNGENEVVLNTAAATQFDQNVTVGDSISILRANGTGVNATVVGVLNGSASRGPFEGFASQPRVYTPTDPFYETSVEIDGENRRVYPLLTVVATGPDAVEPARDEMLRYLEDDSDAASLMPTDYGFSARTNEELLQQVQDLLNTLTGFVTGIAVISLVVGSIGIANIMLVSVTERTKEIGIMKAVGAQRRDVIQLFLVEAVMLGLLGALLGTPVGVGAAYIVAGYIDVSLTFPLEWFAIAIAVGVLVGVVAGLYPAWSAARTDPIDALRYE